MQRLAALLPAALRGRYESLEVRRSYGALDTSDSGAAV